MTIDITRITADPLPGNEQRILEMAQMAESLADDVPFVLLPVRIETRFTQVEEPLEDDPPGLPELATRLDEADRALARIAATDMSTTRTGTAAEHRIFKRDVESPLCDLASKRLAAAGKALDAADALLRHPLDGDRAQRDAVKAAVAGIRSRLVEAGDSMARVRSDWQRERLADELAALAERAATTLAAVETRALPAARIREALAAPEATEEATRREEAERRRLVDPRMRPAPPAAVVRGRPAELAAPERGPVVPIAHKDLAAGAGTFDALLAAVRKLGDDASAAAALVGPATTIPLLPAAWKLELTEAVEKARARAPSADVDALATAVASIRSDDLALNHTVPRPDIVVALPPPTQLVDKLMVRIYPDDIAVDTHEEALTAEESDAGAAFWQRYRAAGADDDARRAAWRALCLGRGPRRAAWIARRTKPKRPAATPGSAAAERILATLAVLEKRAAEVARAAPGERLDALVRASDGLVKTLSTERPVPQWAIDRVRKRYAVVRASWDRLDAELRRMPGELDEAAREAHATMARRLKMIDLRIDRLRAEPLPEPSLPDVGELKEGAWTRAARSGVLPERFLVVAVADGTLAHAVAGAPVPPDLKLSIDPEPDDPDAEGFALEDGELVVGESIRWMIDYPEAVAKGMAVTLDITPDEGGSGFDAVYVIGLRGEGPDDGADRLEALLDNHHFGETGLGLVPVGTATNNTEGAAAGYSSTEDPDASFDVELGPALVDAAQPLDPGAGDGLRLARTLGVDPQTLAHVEGADARGCAEALAMNEALYAATVGATLEEHFGPLISRDSRNRVRAFALGHVAARGLVPTVRVGEQPYGVLPTTAHSRFAPEPAEALGAGAPAGERALQAGFDRRLTLVLQAMASDWDRIRQEERVAYATDPDVDDPRAHFLRLLGLEAVSSAAAYRFAVNVAGRHGAASRDPDLSFDLPPQDPNAPPTAARFGPFALLSRFEAVLRDAFGIAPQFNLLAQGKVSEEFADVYERIQDSRAYGLRHLRRSHTLRGEAVGADPAGYLAALATTAPAALAEQTRDDEDDQPLLALLARQALLYEWLEAALEILEAEGVLSEELRIFAGASSHYVTSSLTGTRSLTRWSFLFAPLVSLQGISFPTGAGTLYGYLNAGGTPMTEFLVPGGPTGYNGFGGGRNAARVQAAERHADGVAALGTIPAERLEPLLREHLDLATHRLDAWVTGLAQRRLLTLRTANPRGAHIGAYGWVEDLSPDGAPLPAEGVPALLNGDPSRPVYEDLQSQGFVHAPSVNHAVTAAILRSGYLSQGGEASVENRMAVNLSSRRTRLALGLIDGVRAGNRLGALLGYRLERFLHEHYATAGVTLDDLIGPLRSAYPSIAGVDAALNPDAAARHVCDGLALVDAVNRWIAANASEEAVGRTVYEVLSDPALLGGHPWGLSSQAIPDTSESDRLDGLLRAIDHVADALDAVADLIVAEAVHQLALGNHPRAAAVLSALGEGKAPPRPEVVDTPRTGRPVSHRLLLALPDTPAGAPAGWEAIPLTARAEAEPALNAWAASLLGSPDAMRLRLVRRTDGADAGDVSVADLGLHALDLLAILAPGLETGRGELEARALDTLRPPDLDDDAPPAPLRLDLERSPSWDDGARGIAELAPLVEALGALVGRARAATAQDYLLGEGAPPGSGDGVDLTELEARVRAARDELAGTGLELARLIADDPALTAEAAFGEAPLAFLEAHPPFTPPSWATLDSWRAALLRAAALGITAALPPARFETRVQVRTAYREAAETAFVEVVERLGRADAQLAEDATARTLDAAAKAVFGEGSALLARAELRNRDELDEALAVELASPAAIDGWLQGVGLVRESAGGLADALVLADAHGAAVPSAAVAQLPHAADATWLGEAVPASEPGRLSLVILDAAALPAAGATGVSLLVDEWNEIIPAAQETTGVAVHYDQPDATAPQCVLVAVPPRRRGTWRLGELVQTLHDTLELARSRAVELEHLQATMYGQLLPAISGELVPEAAGGGPVSGERVILDFGANN